MDILTRKQKDVFVYIRDFIQKKEMAPTLEEIRAYFNFASASTADYYVKNLCKKGYLFQESGKTRTLNVVKDIAIKKSSPLNFISKITVPILGSANAGLPVNFAEEYVEGYVELPATLKSNNIFALRVDGDSMNKCKINGKELNDGSIIFIDSSINIPQNNDIVLTIIDGCATIKKIFIDSTSDVIKLLPNSTNLKHKPIFLTQDSDFVVNGIVVGVF